MKSYIAFLLLVILVSGCKDTDCPAFPSYIIDYFPYTKADILKFENSIDTLEFKISEKGVTESYSISWGSKCDCSAETGFQTSINEKFLLKIEGLISIDNNANRTYLSIDFWDDYSQDFFTILNEDVNPFLQENEYIFGDTLIFENETNNNRITGMRLVKGKGIIDFFDLQENCKWVLIDE